MSDSPDTTPPIDPAWLERMLARPDFARRLFEVFLADEPERVQKLGQAIDKGDLEAVRYLAHSLKGASATLGMARVSAACKALEIAAREGRPGDFAAIHSRIASEMQLVFARLREVMPQD